jgi:hypothetical protein
MSFSAKIFTVDEFEKNLNNISVEENLFDKILNQEPVIDASLKKNPFLTPQNMY